MSPIWIFRFMGTVPSPRTDVCQLHQLPHRIFYAHTLTGGNPQKRTRAQRKVAAATCSAVKADLFRGVPNLRSTAQTLGWICRVGFRCCCVSLAPAGREHIAAADGGDKNQMRRFAKLATPVASRLYASVSTKFRELHPMV